MRLENGSLVMEPEDCNICRGEGKVPTYQPCKKCKGTGKGPRGGRRGCKQCYGSGDRLTFEITKVCDECDGSPEGASMETPFDSLPKAIYSSLEFRVYRSGRQQTFNETLLGFGCIVSVTDYGEHQGWSDERLIEYVRDARTTYQAINFLRDKKDLRICDHVGIYCNSNGYSVRAVFEDADPTDTIKRERGYGEGLAIGTRVYEAGGNGTLAGLYR